MKKFLFSLFALCVLCGCVGENNSRVVSGVTVQKGDGEKIALTNPNNLIEKAEGIEVKYGKTFEKSDGDYQYIWFNGHRYIKYDLTNGTLDGYITIFEDGECPKCKRERQKELNKMKDDIISAVMSSSMLR